MDRRGFTTHEEFKLYTQMEVIATKPSRSSGSMASQQVALEEE
jgi:hypothetical protein